MATAMMGCAALAKPCYAQSCDVSELFNGGPAKSLQYSSAEIGRGAGKIFLNADSGMPRNAYLFEHDEVVVLFTRRNSSCVLFVNDRFEQSIGWLPVRRLHNLEIPKGVMDWQGRFQRDKNGSHAVLTAIERGQLRVSVEAVGLGTPEEENGSLDQGNLDGVGILNATRVHVVSTSTDNCEVNLLRFGRRYLLVQETGPTNKDSGPSGCDGLHATLDGLYIKKN